MPEIPYKKYLPRDVVLNAVGGRRELERHEREGALKRRYPAGMHRARYLRTELMSLLEALRPAAKP